VSADRFCTLEPHRKVFLFIVLLACQDYLNCSAYLAHENLMNADGRLIRPCCSVHRSHKIIKEQPFNCVRIAGTVIGMTQQHATSGFSAERRQKMNAN
jgi:hypothetical protein